MRGPDGEYLGRAWHYRDVTAQRAMEMELSLTRRQLASTEKLAVVGTLVSSVAHEIRTPLTYIMNHVALVRRMADRARGSLAAADRDQITSSVAATEEGAERINRLVQELRRFARRPDGASRVSDVNEAVSTAILFFQAAHRGHVVVEATYGPGLRAPLERGKIE